MFVVDLNGKAPTSTGTGKSFQILPQWKAKQSQWKHNASNLKIIQKRIS